jgi:hypothetical protein
VGCEGRSNKEIAQNACLSLPTVRKHLHSVFANFRCPVAHDLSRWQLDSSVTHANEIQSFGGRSETGRAGFAGVQSRSDFFDAHFVERTFHQGAHH